MRPFVLGLVTAVTVQTRARRPLEVRLNRMFSSGLYTGTFYEVRNAARAPQNSQIFGLYLVPGESATVDRLSVLSSRRDHMIVAVHSTNHPLQTAIECGHKGIV